MEIKGENFKVTETLFDGFSEKSVECDFIVPDYYPDILKIISVEAMPRMKNRMIMGDKLTVEGIVEFRVLYYPENDGMVKSITFVCDFENSFMVKGLDNNSLIKLKIKVENSSFRVLNPRKLSLKAMLCIVAKVLSNSSYDAVKSNMNENLELKTESASLFSFINKAEKSLVLSEELQIGGAMPLINTLLKNDVDILTNDIKVISNKIIVRGTANIKSLYLSEDETFEVMENELPFTQIIDIDGADEACNCSVKYEITEFSCAPKANMDGENSLLTVELSCTTLANIYKNEELSFVTDAYSPLYETKMEKKQLTIEKLSEKIDDVFSGKNSLDFEDSISKIIDMKLTPIIHSVNLSNKTMQIDGDVECDILAFDLSNNLQSLKKTAPFKYSEDLKEIGEHMRFESEMSTSNLSFTLITDNRIDIRYDLNVSTNVLSSKKENVISSIFVETATPKEKRTLPPITLYFAKSGESIWDIAKLYNTSPLLVKQANNTEAETIFDDKMLIIPRKKY